MSASTAPTLVYVTYQGTPGTRFDRTYYVERHLPLVMQAWGRYGLESVAAFFPAEGREGTIAICECRFRDAAAIDAAFASPQTPAVMADVAHFTDVAPAQLRATPL
ncbi:MAG TPA: EthD family reductase [Geminicoccus sp.]|uniref:EthD family reductase n=1 Tax=Geminicoccus sp. TaxID=2024832 RepID=UPI002CBE4DC7|nr:EthD family reductase [Geminicoccus sp.]HWL71933.1 EthD family reductase [Geminicoccus sp.]